MGIAHILRKFHDDDGSRFPVVLPTVKQCNKVTNVNDQKQRYG